MKDYNFNDELKIARTQVLNAFDGLVIKRLLETDNITNTDSIAVNLVYAPKQRVLYDLVNKNQHIQLPIMAFTTSNIKYDPARTFNKLDGYIANSQVLSSGGHIPQPLPIDFDMHLSILVNQNRDLDQIITNIFANFYPYIVISYRHPNINQEVRCKVQWDGNISLQYPNDLAAQTPYRIMADATFNVSTWIFKNFSNPYGIIYNIPTTFTAVSELYDDYETLKTLEGPLVTDYKTVSGRPQIKNVHPYTYNLQTDLSSKTFNILGDMYHLVKGLVVSANNTSTYPTSAYQTFNPFVSDKHLSAVYTSFDAISVQNWVINDSNNISFNLPTPLDAGNVDIIAWNVAGIGKLTTDSYRISGTFQWPFVNGVAAVKHNS